MRICRRGFTLIELLVVIAVIALLMGILLPVLHKIKSQAYTIIGTNNQKQTVVAANLFSCDNDDKYPKSVSFVEYGGNWNWYDPRTLSSWNTTPDHPHRAMGEYLGNYIEDASIMSCPKAPEKFKYLQKAWEAGDEWNNPDTTFDVLAVRGSYCYYWNYVGWLDNEKLFKGPRRSSGSSREQSNLMMTCYFGYDHRRTPNAFGSCEKMKSAGIVEETSIESAWWSRLSAAVSDISQIEVKLQAAFTDGHVENFKPSETIPMKTIMDRSTGEPYPSGLGPGDFFIPKKSLQ